MSLKKGEVVNHPVRLGIIVALSEAPRSPKQLAALLPDVPHATLYRHLNVLLEAGIIGVVGQRQVRGVVEATYEVKMNAARLTREEFAEMSASEHESLHALLIGTSAAALARYVEQPTYDIGAEGMTYFTASLRLSDANAQKLKSELLELVTRYGQTPDVDGRVRLATISLIPEPEKKQNENETKKSD